MIELILEIVLIGLLLIIVVLLNHKQNRQAEQFKEMLDNQGKVNRRLTLELAELKTKKETEESGPKLLVESERLH